MTPVTTPAPPTDGDANVVHAFFIRIANRNSVPSMVPSLGGPLRPTLLIASLLLSSTAHAQAFVSATTALEQDRKDAELTFYGGLGYWAAGGAMVGIGITTLALTNPTGDAPSNRLGLVSGIATTVSGVSSCFSAWPRTLEPFVLKREVLEHGGPMGLDEAPAREVVLEHARWSRRWRQRTLVVTTVLLAVNAIALSAYAIRYSYERVETAIVAGLYGIGVPIVLWYDSLPWSEEVALEQPLPAPSLSLHLQPGVAPGPSGPIFTVAMGLTW
jgi:hypothetical protein